MREVSMKKGNTEIKQGDVTEAAHAGHFRFGGQGCWSERMVFTLRSESYIDCKGQQELAWGRLKYREARGARAV